MTKFFRIVLLSVVSVFVVASAVMAQDETPQPSLTDLPPYQWQSIPLSSEAVCSDGTPYHIYARRGESDNTIVHFSGGGACWDYETCSQPISILSFDGFYFPRIYEALIVLMAGIFQHQNAENPFSAWNVVYLPYCTADFHVGAATNEYTSPAGKAITIHHNGRQNVTEALDWVYANIDAPEKLLVSGESAGAWGSLFWVPTLAEHYTESEVYHLADGAYLETERWSEFVDEKWGADFEANFGFAPGTDIVGSAYAHYAENPAPNLTYLHANSLYDNVILHFGRAITGTPADDAAYMDVWSEGMRASMGRAAESGLPYNYYITDYDRDPVTGLTPHTFTSFGLFYTVEEDSVRYLDWVRRIVLENERLSVGETFVAPLRSSSP